VKRNKREYLLGLLLAFIMVLGYATLCMASGDASVPVAAPEGKPPVFGNLYVIGWSAVNFFVLLALLYKFGFNPVNAMLEQRANTIESSIKHAEEIRVEVDQLRKEAQANLAESRKEAQEIVARATKAAEDAKAEISAQAKEEAASMKVELRNTAATLAMMAAEKVLGRAITEEDHKKMVKEFVDEAGDFLC
jgi:F-type H+-transporting ATPase subunit b